MFLNRYMNLFLTVNIFLMNPSFALQLLSHKATYTLNVENIKNSFLEGGQGQTFFEIQEVCNGWKVREDYVLMYQLPNNKSAKSYSSFTTFENKNSTKHSFQLTEKSDLNGENDYQGFVEKNQKNISGSLINQNIKKLSFNKNTLFPLEHLKRVIEKAKKGQNIFTSEVFFGNEESNHIKIVSTFISNKKQVSVQNLKNFSKIMVWPIKIAFYSKTESKTKPDYEISLELDEVGVVYSYKVDYGDFEVKAKLKDFKVIDKQLCNSQ
jgi:hypothetical protein